MRNRPAYMEIRSYHFCHMCCRDISTKSSTFKLSKHAYTLLYFISFVFSVTGIIQFRATIGPLVFMGYVFSDGFGDVQALDSSFASFACLFRIFTSQSFFYIYIWTIFSLPRSIAQANDTAATPLAVSLKLVTLQSKVYR